MKSGFIVVLLLLLRSSAALACSCVDGSGSEKQKIAAAYQRDALVFVGRVIRVETVVITDTVHVSDRGPIEQRVRLVRHEMRRYTFSLARQFKGSVGASTVLVSTEVQGSMCGREFKVGSDYLVHAYQISEKGSLYGGPPTPVPPYFATSLCHRGQELKAVKRAELKYLQKLATAG